MKTLGIFTLFITTSALGLPATPPQTIHEDSFNSFASQLMLSKMNEARKKESNTLPTLKKSKKCQTLAEEQAFDMALCDYFSHERPACPQRKQGPITNEPSTDRFSRLGFKNQNYAENIALTKPADYNLVTAVNQTIDGLLKSPGHRKNLLNPIYTAGAAAHYRGYWVQCFSDE